MKKTLFIALGLITNSIISKSQILPSLPANSKNYGATTYLGPDGILWYGTESLQYRGVYPKTKIDSLLALIPINTISTSLNGKAEIDGGNATGTWPISISGKAALATRSISWDGYDGSYAGNTPDFLMAFNPLTSKFGITGVANLTVGSARTWGDRAADFEAIPPIGDFYPIGIDFSDGIVKRLERESFHKFLNINNGKTLYNSISGNAATSTLAYNSQLWNGVNFWAGNVTSPIRLLTLNAEGTASGYSTIEQVAAALGSPSGSINLQTVTDIGSITTNPISARHYTIPSVGLSNSFTIGTDDYSNLFIYDNTSEKYRLSVLNNGNVGIGTTAPAAKLDVDGAGGTGLMVKGGDTGAGTTIAQFFKNDGTNAVHINGEGKMTLSNNLAGTTATFAGNVTAPTFNGNLTGSASQWAGNNFDGIDAPMDTYVLAYHGSGNVGYSSMPHLKTALGIPSGGINLQNVTDGGNATANGALFGNTTSVGNSGADNRLYIDPTTSIVTINAAKNNGSVSKDLALQNSGGNVGIGVITPIAKLQVKSEDITNPTSYIYNPNTAAGTSKGLAVEGGTNSSDYSAIFNSSNGNRILTLSGDGSSTFSGNVTAPIAIIGGATIGGGTSNLQADGTNMVIRPQIPSGATYFQKSDGSVNWAYVNQYGFNGNVVGNLTGSASQWAGNNFDGINAPIDTYVIAYHGSGNVGYSSIPDLKTALGIPSGGETFRSVVAKGNVADSEINVKGYSDSYTYLGGIGASPTTKYARLGGYSTGGAGAVPLVLQDAGGNVGIGTTNPREKLSVNGKIRAQEIKVEASPWPDYVFTKSYHLPTLQETEKHIKEKGHLPGIPSAEEVKTNGIDLGEMNAKLLQKIEELTLHLIDIKKENEMLNERLLRVEKKQ